MDYTGNVSLYNAAQWAWIRKRRKEGYTLQELADFLGVTLPTVHHHTKGVKPRKRAPLNKRKAEFYRLAEGGKP